MEENAKLRKQQQQVMKNRKDQFAILVSKVSQLQSKQSICIFIYVYVSNLWASAPFVTEN